jgi:hypothetical protein
MRAEWGRSGQKRDSQDEENGDHHQVGPVLREPARLRSLGQRLDDCHLRESWVLCSAVARLLHPKQTRCDYEWSSDNGEKQETHLPSPACSIPCVTWSSACPEPSFPPSLLVAGVLTVMFFLLIVLGVSDGLLDWLVVGWSWMWVWLGMVGWG